MKEIIGTLVIMLFCIIALAQEKPSEDIILSRNKIKPLKPVKPHEDRSPGNANISRFVSPISLQILAGSQGIGADFKYGFLQKLSARLGFSMIPVDVNRGFGVSGFKVDGLFSSRFSNLHLLADYSPFKTENIRIVGGAAYLMQGNAKAIITPKDGYNVGERSLTKDQIGVLYADVTWKGIAPYLGVSLLRSFPNRLFNVNLDIGTYYLNSPSTSFTGTKLLSENTENARHFNENMQGYHWLPVVQLNFNFRIK